MPEMIDFSVNQFEPSENDVLFQLENPGPEGGEPATVNLTAVRFYARLGLKPKSIQWMDHINCTAMTIFKNQKIFKWYEQGKAQHEIYLRTYQMQYAADPKAGPFMIDAMLNRAAGKSEVDHQAGMNPEEVDAAPPEWKIEAPVFTAPKQLTASERAEIEGTEDN